MRKKYYISNSNTTTIIITTTTTPFWLLTCVCTLLDIGLLGGILFLHKAFEIRYLIILNASKKNDMYMCRGKLKVDVLCTHSGCFVSNLTTTIERKLLKITTFTSGKQILKKLIKFYPSSKLNRFFRKKWHKFVGTGISCIILNKIKYLHRASNCLRAKIISKKINFFQSASNAYRVS